MRSPAGLRKAPLPGPAKSGRSEETRAATAGPEGPPLLTCLFALMTKRALQSANRPGRTTLASLTIRNLEPAIKERLRVRAAHQGRSMEAEARAILEMALAGTGDHAAGRTLSERIHARFAAIGGVELELPPRDAGRPLPEFD